MNPGKYLKFEFNRTSFYGLLGAASIIGSFYVMGGLRSDHWYLSGLIALLSVLGPLARRLLGFLLPLILTGVVYDSQRWYSDLIRGRIRVEEPYLFDLGFFGIITPEGVLTPNEWFQKHTHWLLDFITGFYYLTFIGMFVLFAAYICFYVSKTGTSKASATQIQAESKWIMWSFFIVNCVGYSTYYWYPAAPPWYVELYGLGPADLTAQANPAGCIRFDELLGTSFFRGMYGRSADVFGAIPSLHIAYPLQAVFYAYRFGVGRAFAVSFYLIMCFSAVYLNHHYVLDLIWGSAYAVLIHGMVHGIGGFKRFSLATLFSQKSRQASLAEYPSPHQVQTQVRS